MYDKNLDNIELCEEEDEKITNNSTEPSISLVVDHTVNKN